MKTPSPLLPFEVGQIDKRRRSRRSLFIRLARLLFAVTAIGSFVYGCWAAIR